LLGMVDWEEVRKVPKNARASRRVGEVMSPLEDLPVVAPLEEASEALNKLTRSGVPQLPVVEDGNLVGVLRRRDILRWLKLQSDLV
jgi:CBS domain-containing protein